MTNQLVRQPTASVASEVIRLTSASLAAMLLAAAVVHLVRNSLMEFPQVNYAFGWIASLLVVGLTAAARYAWRRMNPSGRGAKTRTVWAVSSLAALVWSSSLTLVSRNAADVLTVWLIVLISETSWWLLLLRSTPNRARLAPSNTNRVSNGPRALMTALTESENLELKAELDDSVVQQLTRSETEEHGELIHGLLRCRFCTGERSKTQHVAFCPPLDLQPNILVDQISGPAARIKVAQAESFGVRFEIRLDRVCRRPSEFVFEFFASTSDEGERINAA